MRIRMLAEMGGSRNGRPWPAVGAIADLPTAEAAHYVASGIAEEVGDDVPDDDVRAPDADAAADAPSKPARRARKPSKGT